MTKKIIFNILSYWHIGTGLGKGGAADAVMARDADKLPYIPGKAVKGLFREACQTLEDAGHLAKETTTRLFGEATKKDSDTAAEGKLSFSNAHLQQAERNWLITQSDSYKEALFTNIASTKLDDNGLAEDHSLRILEVCIPLTLEANIDFVDDHDLDSLKKAMPLIRSLGAHRHRGLGRCQVGVQS